MIDATKMKEIIMKNIHVYGASAMNPRVSRSYQHAVDNAVDEIYALLDAQGSILETKPTEDWRDGQTIFNFLEWIREQYPLVSDTKQSNRMADPFNISDANLRHLYKEFIQQLYSS